MAQQQKNAIYEVIYTAALGFGMATAFWWACFFLYLEFG